MIKAELTSRTTASVVRISITDPNATIEVDTNPHRPEPVTVTEMTISYKATETFHGNLGRLDAEVSDITYRVSGQDFDTVSVDRDFLDKPEEWAGWVRDMVEEHTPEAA